jgi:hypothetical protein
MNDNDCELRPRDFALLLLAAGDVAIRDRARDQQADLAGLALKRRMLNEMVAVDPESHEMAAFLFELPKRLDAASCSIRSLALAVMQEWQTARVTPNWRDNLLDLAARHCQKESGRRGQQLPG